MYVYMPYAGEGIRMCWDAFDACIHATTCLLARCSGPLFICVFVWHVSKS